MKPIIAQSQVYMPARQAMIAVLVLIMLISGCAPASKATPTVPPPDPATNTPAPTPTLAPTNTPVPTSTPTATPTSTPTPDRTKEANEKATKAAVDALALIKPDLEKLGFTTDQGELSWISEEPLELVSTTHEEENLDYITLDPVKDFVLQTDIEWNSTAGFAGCAISFRVNPELNQGSRYWFPLMRLQAAPAWDIEFHQYLRTESNLFGKVLYDTNIKDQPGDSNKLALIVQGNKFTAYINGKKYRTVEHNKLTDGLIGFSSWQNSGKTTCTFSNGWLFLLK